MDLEEINNNYGELKQKIANAEKKYEELNAKVKKLQKPYYKCQYELEDAKEKGNEAEIKKAQEKLNDIKKKVGEIKAEAKKQKETIENLKGKINEKIELIKNDPELKKQIDSALLRRYERQENTLTKEKDELVEKRAKLASFKDMINEHPNLAHSLKGILTGIKLLDDAEAKIEENTFEVNGTIKWKDINISGELLQKKEEANKKLQQNLDIMREYCDKHNIDKDEINNYINTLAETYVERNGQTDLELTFNRSIKKMDKKIISYDKQIADYNTLKNELRNSLGLPDNTLENKSKDETLKDGKSENVPENTLGENKLKWWQFGTKFKNWLARKKLSRVGGLPAPSNTTENVKEDTKKASENFRYEIMREAMESQQKDDFKFAKEVRKQNKEDKDIDEEER